MQIYLIDLLFLLELGQVDQQAEKQVAHNTKTFNWRFVNILIKRRCELLSASVLR